MGTVQTSIGFDGITVSGEFNITGKAVERGFGCNVEVGEVFLYVTTQLVPDTIIYAMGIPGDNGLFGGGAFVRSEHVDTGVSIPFTYSAGGFHIQRSYGIELVGAPPRGRMKPVSNNPSTLPTHSIELTAEDDWVVDDDPGTLSLSFGSVQWSGLNGWNPTPPGSALIDPEFYIQILPSSNIIISFSSVWDRAFSYTGCVATLSTNITPYNFDGVSRETPVGAGDGTGVIRLTGAGDELTWWNDEDTGGNYGVGMSVTPPHAADWSCYGLCDWGETEHNERYDDVLVWGGFRKVPEMDDHFTWPLRAETENPSAPPGLSGTEFEYGEEVPVRLGELRALGAYVQPPRVPHDTLFWGGSWLSLRVDRQSHVDHDLYVKPDLEEHPLRFPIGINHLGSPLPSTDPHFDIPVSRFDVDADVPDGLSGRPTAWQANGFTLAGGGVDTSGDVEFTVAGGGTLSRTLRSNWLARCTALNEYGAATGNWAVFPAGYLVHRANYMRELHGDWDWEDIEAETGYVEEDEDVTYYSSHRYLQFALEGPEGADGTEMQVLLTYRVETVTDDHILDLTGPVGMREVECTLGPIQTLELEGIYDQHNSVLTVDMAEPPSALPDLRHVESVSIVFTDAHDGAWTLTGMRLVHADDEPVTLVTAHEPRQGYVAGGVRGVVNGLHPYALVSSGNYRTYGGQEQLVEHVNWYWTETLQLTQDGSAAWTLDDYLGILSGACEGWDWELPDDWEAMTTDHTEAVLSSGYSFDLAERQGEVVDETEEIAGAYPARLSAWRWRTAPQLLYKPRGVVCVQGGIHGLSDERSGTGGTVLYDGGQIAVGSDANGYYQCGVDVVRDYPEYWSYTLGDVRFLRTYERQYCAAYFAFPTCRQPHLALDDAGRVWLAANDGRNNVRVYWRSSPQQPWERCADAFRARRHAHPCITPMHDGRLIVSATASDGTVETVESVNDGVSWHDLA